mmetsp:Transcript_77710/g.130446  ORF Transcript_77710/g.130446 Transcript_77710/m.130446 type:complete len:354 (-) Transcript_77710:275-1336(-)
MREMANPINGVEDGDSPLHCQLDVCDCAVGQCSGRSTPQEDTVNLSKHLLHSGGTLCEPRVGVRLGPLRELSLNHHVQELHDEGRKVPEVHAVPQGQEQQGPELRQLLVPQEPQPLHHVDLHPGVGVDVEVGDDVLEAGGKLISCQVDVAHAVPHGVALLVHAVVAQPRQDVGGLAQLPHPQILVHESAGADQDVQQPEEVWPAVHIFHGIDEIHRVEDVEGLRYSQIHDAKDKALQGRKPGGWPGRRHERSLDEPVVDCERVLRTHQNASEVIGKRQHLKHAWDFLKMPDFRILVHLILRQSSVRYIEAHSNQSQGQDALRCRPSHVITVGTRVKVIAHQQISNVENPTDGQ